MHVGSILLFCYCVSSILLFYYSVKETSSLNELLEHFLDPVKGDPLMRYRLINQY